MNDGTLLEGCADLHATAAALDARAITLRTSGDLAAALQVHQRALDAFTQLYGPHSLDAAICWRNLAHVQQRCGAWEAARASLTQAITVRRLFISTDPCGLANALHDLGDTLRRCYLPESAAAAYAEALTLRTTHAPGTLALGTTLNSYAVLCAERGEPARALLLYEQALALGATRSDAWNLLNVVHGNIVQLHVARGDVAAARVTARNHWHAAQAYCGSDSPAAHTTRHAYAHALWRCAAQGAALAHLEDLLHIHTRADRTLIVGAILDDLTRLTAVRREYGRAQGYAERALALREQHCGAEHPDTGYALNELALLVLLHQPANALPLFERALAIVTAAFGPTSAAATAISANLARCANAAEVHRWRAWGNPPVIAQSA